MRPAAWDAWVAKARSVRIEDECSRRGIVFNGQAGKTERCGPCPKCGGEDRFAVNTKKQVFNCRGCGACGDVVAFVRFLDDSDFAHAVEVLTGERPKRTAKLTKAVVAAEYRYHNADGTLAFIVERVEHQNADGSFAIKDDKCKKTFRQKRPDPDRPGKFVWNTEGVPIVPYALPEVTVAIAGGRTIFIVEGEKCVDSLRELGAPATTNRGGAGKWRPELNAFFMGADVVLVPDNDDAGHKHVQEIGAALTGVAKRIRVLVLPGLPPKGDIADWLAAGGTREVLEGLVEQAPGWQRPIPAVDNSDEKAKAEADEQRLIDLARLSPLDYEQQRSEAAKDLGIRRGALDDEVETRRAEQRAQSGPPPLFGHWEVEPWPEEVDTDALLLSLKRRVQRHIVLSDEAATVVALWILFAWVHDTAAVHSPFLLVTSPQANCGKSTLLSTVAFLVPRALLNVEISEAALFRSIELWLPTIIVDEADMIFVNNEPLRAVFNSGWTRGAVVLRCIGDDKVPHAFPTFCPRALGMKGRKLPETTLSRSIIIELKRKTADEKAEHFRAVDDPGLEELRRQALRWATDNAQALNGAEPQMPPGFDNRLGDNFRLLLAIADLAGGEWPERAREAAQTLSGAGDTASTDSQLLADIRAAFDEAKSDVLSSADLVGKLTAEPDSQWAEWRSGKPITQNQLARLLKPFGIAPGQVWITPDRQSRGYRRDHFKDAWVRYR
jgi:putative DNA primase/helicase